MGFCVGVDDEEGFWKKALYIYIYIKGNWDWKKGE